MQQEPKLGKHWVMIPIQLARKLKRLHLPVKRGKEKKNALAKWVCVVHQPSRTWDCWNVGAIQMCREETRQSLDASQCPAASSYCLQGVVNNVFAVRYVRRSRVKSPFRQVPACHCMAVTILLAKYSCSVTLLLNLSYWSGKWLTDYSPVV